MKKNIKYLTILIAAVIWITKAESQNDILISGTSVTVQQGLPIYNVGSLTIADNGSAKGSLNNSGTINITGDLNNDSQQDSLGQGDITFTGSLPENVSGTNVLGAMTLDKSSGDVTLSGNMTVTGEIDFISGILNTSNANLLTLSSSAVIEGATTNSSGANDESYVNGPMVKEGNEDFIFPIGKKTAEYPLHPLGMQFSESGMGSYKAEYINNTTLNATEIPSNVTYVSQSEYWTLSQMSGKNTAYISLGIRDITPSNPNDYVVMNYDSLNDIWKDAGNTSFQMTSRNEGLIRSGLIHNFTDFTYGTTTEAERTILESKSNSLKMNVYPNPTNGTNINIDLNKK